jgi:hypothetical protein
MSLFEQGNYMFSAKSGVDKIFIVPELLEGKGIKVLQQGTLCFWLRKEVTHEDARKLESLLNDLVEGLTYQIG